MRPLFVLRWSARDLRRRWFQVVATALVIAIGTGVYSALGSTKTWRYTSNDASFEELAMYDLRVRSVEGTDAPARSMLAALDRLPDPGVVAVAEERLVVDTQVDASSPDEPVLVPGRIVGLDTTDSGPHVTRLAVDDDRGRTLRPDDAGQPVAVLERSFADAHDLPTTGELRLSGGHEVAYLGTGTGPEYFLVTTEEGGFFAHDRFAVVFTSLETAQRLAGREGRVNDLVLRLREGSDPDAVAAALTDAFAASGLGVTVMTPDDEDAYRLLYDDIESDAEFWNIFAGLILAGAAFGAFNLSSRMVEAQRREIGIGMALGFTTPQLAVRPLLAGAQIAVAGAIAGVGMGYVVIVLIRPLFMSLVPLPVWYTELQWGPFVRGAALGVVIPLVATAWPVWRAVRVMPVEAITTTHRRSRSGLAPLLRRLPWPVSALRRMPVGNVLRTPRRTLLTALGIGAAVATLVALLGMLDSFVATMDHNERLLLGDRPDRMVVALDGIVAAEGPEVAEVAAVDSLGSVEPGLRVGARLDPGGADLEALLEVVDLGSDLWAPTVEAGRLPVGETGLVLSHKAADDLGVAPGDEVIVEHPAADPAGGIAVVRTPMPVTGIHPGPLRFSAYLDRSQLASFGAEGLANQLYVAPAPGHSTDDVEVDLFPIEAVASVAPVEEQTSALKDALDEFLSLFRVLQGFIVGLVLLIAYNATNINADERAKERATLFAFGLPVRRVVALEIVEGLLIGVLGTATGLALGTAVLHWLLTSTVTATMPDVGFDVALGATSLVSSVVLGVAAVAVAPLLTIRRLRRMDIPGTLRIVE